MQGNIEEIKVARAKGALLGLAVGDALGTTLEFKPKDSYNPLTDMVGGGPFGLQPGQWTDDTAMMLCLSDSLIETGGMDLCDQARRYVRWVKQGENSCTGHCFDVGMTVREALSRFEKTGNPKAGSNNEYSAGNGSLMRIAPVGVFYANSNERIVMEAAAQSSLTTHGEERCLQACELMTLLIHRALNEKVLLDKHLFLSKALQDYIVFRPDCHPDIWAIAEGGFFIKSRDDIRGTGFVIEALEAALWCFMTSEHFEEGALLAANLGEDADTTAAIYGQLAGAFYGVQSIPVKWLNTLAWRNHIAETAVCLISQTKRL
ncbi:ADP-ribosylglycohydrolase family protein [Grimontia hollisae]|uniref:ADP-ribosylglycohydrolase family protein n=1 Tax=Grimontia hollisae TaxID=673 RepID=UPI00130318C4|nr:ADP-ribosylglycohydrolase family protein [Grimontia hollisae]